LHNKARAATTLAGVVGCVRDEIMHRLQELKAMTKDIAASHDTADSCDSYRQFDPQFDSPSHPEFNR
jgi:hypothetical protein